MGRNTTIALIFLVVGTANVLWMPFGFVSLCLCFPLGWGIGKYAALATDERKALKPG